MATIRKPRSRTRYPIVMIRLDDIGYYWEHVKIRAADYKAFLMQTDMELQITDGTADKELRAIYDSIKKSGLLNPLIVTQYQGRIFSVVGCQRLAALRILDRQGILKSDLIPCRIADDFDEEPILKFHPQKKWSVHAAAKKKKGKRG